MKTVAQPNLAVSTKFNYKSPVVFAIPLDVYRDEIEKERNKEAFLKIKNLRKKCEQLRQKLHAYSEKQVASLTTTEVLVQQAKD